MKNVLLRTERLRKGWSQQQLADFQEEVEEAYRYAEQALAIMAQTRSPRTFERVLDLRRALEQWKAEQSVKNLDEQIATLRPSVSLWKR